MRADEREPVPSSTCSVLVVMEEVRVVWKVSRYDRRESLTARAIRVYIDRSVRKPEQ